VLTEEKDALSNLIPSTKKKMILALKIDKGKSEHQGTHIYTISRG